MALRWYLARSKPQCEYIAAQTLRRDGFDIFFPCVESPRPRPGRGDTPLFPGYLFVRYDVERQSWPAVGQLPGVLGWVRLGGIVPAVPDDVVEGLGRRVAQINSSGGLWTRFRPGQRVRVLSGRMDGLAEVVSEPTSPEDRVRVLLEFMGRLVPAQVPWANLRPATDDATEVGDLHRRRRTRGRGRWVRGVGPRALAGA